MHIYEFRVKAIYQTEFRTKLLGTNQIHEMTPIPGNGKSQKRTVFACEICIYVNCFNAQYVRSILKFSM